MITPSETARRVAPLGQMIGAREGEAARMYHKHERAKKEKPCCTKCGARVSSDKVTDPHRLCEPCVREKTDRILAGQERAPFDPDRQMPPANKGKPLPNLKTYREQRGWGIGTLGRYASVNKNTIKRAEEGWSVGEGVARKLANTLKVSVEDLCQ